MNKPAQIWAVFGVCLAVLLAAMGWVSWTALRFERAQREAQQKADFEESVRLALWRMDSTLSPLIVQESSRPYFTYNAFYAAERAYNRMFSELKPGEVLVPSPLLSQTATNVLLHFQCGPDGLLTSPQVPIGNNRDLAESRYLSAEQISAASQRLKQLQQLVTPAALNVACVSTLPREAPMNSSYVFNGGSRGLGGNAGGGINAQQQNRQDPQQQVLRNSMELQARNQSYQQAATWNGYNSDNNALTRANVAEGMVKPIWFGDALVLARRVSVEGKNYIQGCWLDWPGIRSWLLASIQDLLPEAALVPNRDLSNEAQARLLASLPLKLVPGPAPAVASGGFSPIWLALAFAWACMLLAAVAVAVLLYGAVSLSERRGAFVSAVTHELRTPLTTFKMYSEMLAEGMVPEESKRRQYLNTLCSEANRLSHLVENVLAYARLERGSARSRVERITIQALIERVRPRLVQRAEQADMRWAEDVEKKVAETQVHVDVSAVEQILFNLVDNACKYGALGASETVLHLEALPDGKCAMLRVRDHGPGINAEAAKRLFKPFSKSAHEAANSAPGVGLGLALCRRLSRSMGGDLRLDGSVKTGACFVLQLPVSQAGRGGASI